MPAVKVMLLIAMVISPFLDDLFPAILAVGLEPVGWLIPQCRCRRRFPVCIDYRTGVPLL
jgi:hypothetical protein